MENRKTGFPDLLFPEQIFGGAVLWEAFPDDVDQRDVGHCRCDLVVGPLLVRLPSNLRFSCMAVDGAHIPDRVVEVDGRGLAQPEHNDLSCVGDDDFGDASSPAHAIFVFHSMQVADLHGRYPLTDTDPYRVIRYTRGRRGDRDDILSGWRNSW